MAKILNNLTISSSISKLIELPNHYVINGQFYNKTDISPVPLTFGVYNTSVNCEMVMNSICATTGVMPVRVKNGVVVDSDDPSVSYTVKAGSHNHTDGYSQSIIYKTSIDNFDNVSISSYIGKANGGSKRGAINIIEQDKNFLYIQTTWDNYRSTVSKINKDTMTESNIYDLGIDKCLTFIKSTESFLYFSVSGTNGYFAIVKYNKVNGAGTIIKNDSVISGTYTTTCKTVVDSKNNNVFYAIKDGYSVDQYHRSIIVRYTIDTDTDLVMSYVMNLDLSSLTYGNSIPNTNNHIGAVNELFTLEHEEDSYLVYIRYGSNINSKDSSIFVFKFISQNELKLVQEINLNPSIFTMVLTTNNNKTLAIGNNINTRFYVWNHYSKSFEYTANVNKPTMLIGADVDGNIFLQYEDSSVDAYSDVMPFNVTANLEEEEYSYNGAPIATNAVVYVQSLSSEFISANVELTLIGPAKFTSNEKTKITTRTSKDSAIIVPVTITGPGHVKIAINLL